MLRVETPLAFRPPLVARALLPANQQAAAADTLLGGIFRARNAINHWRKAHRAVARAHAPFNNNLYKFARPRPDSRRQLGFNAALAPADRTDDRVAVALASEPTNHRIFAVWRWQVLRQIRLVTDLRWWWPWNRPIPEYSQCGDGSASANRTSDGLAVVLALEQTDTRIFSV